jgi:hypothetical protein
MTLLRLCQRRLHSRSRRRCRLVWGLVLYTKPLLLLLQQIGLVAQMRGRRALPQPSCERERETQSSAKSRRQQRRRPRPTVLGLNKGTKPVTAAAIVSSRRRRRLGDTHRLLLVLVLVLLRRNYETSLSRPTAIDRVDNLMRRCRNTGTENALLAPLYTTNSSFFTRTGSGQTQENLRKEAFVFCNRDVIRRQTTELGEAHEDTLATRR